MLQTDIFTIAQSGLNSQQSLLNTTANNIANVNTDGYVRQRGQLESQEVGGVLFTDVERQFDRFSYEQRIRDTARLGDSQAYFEKIDLIDNLLATESNSLAAGFNRLFGALQTATDEPDNLSARQLVIAQSEALVGQFNSVNEYYRTATEAVNDEASDLVTQANDLIRNISEINEQLRSTQFAPQTSGSEAVRNERDQAILELSQLLEVDTLPQTDGGVLVNLTTGQPLVLEDGSFNLFAIQSDPDPTRRELELTAASNPNVVVPLGNSNVGGEIGGVLRFRDEILEDGQRALGQISLAFADAMNEQNNLGLDLDNELGRDLFTLPSVNALAFNDNTNGTAGVAARMTDGAGDQYVTADFRVTIDAVNAGAPNQVDITVEWVNADGSNILNSDGTDRTFTYTNVDAVGGTFTPIDGGIELEFTDGATYSVGDRYLLQPAKSAASFMSLATTRPEDLAFASPVRVESGFNNLGNASIRTTSVTNTFIDATLADANTSAFFDTTRLQTPGAETPGGGVGPPAQIEFTGPDDFVVRDSAGTAITTVTNATTLENILDYAENNGAGPAWPAAWTALNDYPGFDFSIEGIPQAGDTFDINYNTNGFSDNSNGRALANIQDSNSILQSSDGNSSTITFNQAYGNIVNNVGTKASTAEVNLDAAIALERQSRDLFNSISGVNLDEEASDLIRFQQAYSASARVLTTAQSLFQDILRAVG